MSILEQIVHRYAKQVRANGRLCLSTNGDPTLLAVFKELGWTDPHILDAEPELEAATVEAPERAVMPTAKGRRG